MKFEWVINCTLKTDITCKEWVYVAEDDNDHNDDDYVNDDYEYNNNNNNKV